MALLATSKSGYADVTPGPTPELVSAVSAANDPADLDPSFGRGTGRWYATTIDARQLTWGAWAWCKVTSSCNLYPVDSSSDAHTRADDAMRRSVADAAAAARALVGDGDHPVVMSADLGEVGGPSAGLMMTLAFIDAATEGDLTGGQVVAGTGTMNDLLEVGPVSGVDRKVQGAIDAGATVFFVPHLKADDAYAAAEGTGLTVVTADHLPDALRWLCAHGGESTVCTNLPADE